MGWLQMYVLVNVFTISKLAFCSVYFRVSTNFPANCRWLIERLSSENDFLNSNENWLYAKFSKERLVRALLTSSKAIKRWDEERRSTNEVTSRNAITLNLARFHWEKKNNIIWYVCDDFADCSCNPDVNDKF